MDSNGQKMTDKQVPEESINEQCNEIEETILSGKKKEETILSETTESEKVILKSTQQKDISDEKIASLEAQLADVQARERDSVLRVKAEMENLRRRTEQDIERVHKFALERFVSELLPVIDNLDRALEVANKANPNMASMIEGVKLTLKSMIDVIRKFGVEIIADTNVPLDPNIHQAIAMVESEEVTAGNVLSVIQKGYTLNGRTIRAAMVTVAKSQPSSNGPE